MKKQWEKLLRSNDRQSWTFLSCASSLVGWNRSFSWACSRGIVNYILLDLSSLFKDQIWNVSFIWFGIMVAISRGRARSICDLARVGCVAVPTCPRLTLDLTIAAYMIILMGRIGAAAAARDVWNYGLSVHVWVRSERACFYHRTQYLCGGNPTTYY